MVFLYVIIWFWNCYFGIYLNYNCCREGFMYNCYRERGTVIKNVHFVVKKFLSEAPQIHYTTKTGYKPQNHVVWSLISSSRSQHSCLGQWNKRNAETYVHSFVQVDPNYSKEHYHQSRRSSYPQLTPWIKRILIDPLKI